MTPIGMLGATAGGTDAAEVDLPDARGGGRAGACREIGSVLRR